MISSYSFVPGARVILGIAIGVRRSARSTVQLAKQPGITASRPRQWRLLPLEDGRLQIKYKADFHDNSGRRDFGSKEFFVRGKPPEVTRNPIRNVTPEEATKRILQCVLPTYPDSHVRPPVVGTVEIGLVISTSGEVIDGTRFLGGPTLFRDSAMQAVRQWKFKRDLEDGQPTLWRVRALLRYRADMSTEVALASAILPDSFGDRGTPRNEETEAGLPALPCEN